MNVFDLVERARSCLAKSTVYTLDREIPPSISEWPTGTRCDCSGYIAWCVRASRGALTDRVPAYKNAGGFNTDGIFRDALNPQPGGLFKRIDAAQPGCILVYPDYKDANGKARQGHVGLVIETKGPRIEDVTRVIHCSFSNYKETQDAIQVTDAGAWTKHPETIIVWLKGLT
jgi:hypothetical protein